MGSASKASWMVAVSVGAVEALKDQGICRWNYAFRSIHQRVKNNMGSFSQTRRMSSSSSLETRKIEEVEHRAKQSEESLRKVIYLSSWGPLLATHPPLLCIFKNVSIPRCNYLEFRHI
ncbi:uncharacterized protein LOC120277960 [Dioscorea cayenensis subsp. rotundata]|uniref:Uncharacterized protein LOC120277960 n=1 Tax=Dioscorea cayennensis subsp. rotundata TaxID=55577 RepID=A0AB40CRN6_DIOCR|nr:uncharacterized protein LOC120277960 [Dioscorea cayenensis subsp. rotundata]